jgi:hypothetical protein
MQARKVLDKIKYPFMMKPKKLETKRTKLLQFNKKHFAKKKKKSVPNFILNGEKQNAKTKNSMSALNALTQYGTGSFDQCQTLL